MISSTRSPARHLFSLFFLLLFITHDSQGHSSPLLPLFCTSELTHRQARHVMPFFSILHRLIKLSRHGQCACWIYALAVVVVPAADMLSRYLSTTSRPHSSLTTGIVAGTSIWNVMAEFAGPVQTENSFLAALMASLIAQCTEEARRSGGSPDAANKDPKHVMSGLQAAIVGEFKLQLTVLECGGD